VGNPRKKRIPKTLSKRNTEPLPKYKNMLNVNMNKREEIINQGARRGCSLSSSLFNIYIYIYIDDLIRKCKEQIKTGIKLKQRQYIITLLFADDQILIQDKEDNL
jgi:hypothetical protein